MVQVRGYEYDGGAVGDGFLTEVTESPGGGAADRVTTIWNDWRGRPVAVKAGAEASEGAGVDRPLVYTDFDNLGNAVRVRVYDGDGVTPNVTAGVPVAPAAALLRGRTDAAYDALGRVYRTAATDPTTTYRVSTTLKANTRVVIRGWSQNSGTSSQFSGCRE